MNIREVTSEKVSLYKRCDQTFPYKNGTILEALQLCMTDKAKKITLRAREILATKGKEEYTKIKQELPCATFSAVFEMDKPRWICNATLTNTIALDIDHISDSGRTCDEIKQILISYPSVYWVQESCSGDGVFALVRISNGADMKKVFEWFNKDLKDKYGIVLDKLKDPTRLRFLAWDDKPLYREEVIPCVQEYEPEPELFDIPKFTNVYSSINLKKYDHNDDELVRKAIWKVLNSGYTVQSYGAWYHAGCEFANFSDGYEMFEKFSNNYGKQTRSISSKWEECTKNPESMDNVKIKWLGMAKNKFGAEWWKEK